MTPLRAGDLRHKITVRRATEIKTDTGGYKTDWCDYAELWAEVTALDGREIVMDQVLQGISVYRVRIRWRSDLTTEDQLRSAADCFGGRDVNVLSIADPDGRRNQLIIMADTASTRN
jgi:SPP1 family predicted phage head-tail adaptor